ncbi:sugar phosphate isomerase/epimerase family protein [Streptomyces sp. NPDC047981]|uniref:sugar phosphate isomerase/epimerase family protein n=1 Tax=Streptomyces sp. NPDC047981 TaxID=3154610 RepID=UPI00344864CD
MKYAVFTASTPELTHEEAVAEIAGAGYDGIEWRITDQPPAEEAEDVWAANRSTWPFTGLASLVGDIARVTAEGGLEMPALGTYTACGEPESVEAAMAVARDLGVRQLRVMQRGYDSSAPLRAQWDRCRAEYRDVARLAARYGVRALIEIHHGYLASSPAAAAALVEGLDPEHVAVIHDQGNMVYEGWTEYRKGLEELGPHLAHVHLKNGLWEPEEPDGERADGATRWRNLSAPLREGRIDVAALLGALRAVGYDGWITFEDFAIHRPPRERLRDNLAYVKDLLADIDVTAAADR